MNKHVILALGVILAVFSYSKLNQEVSFDDSIPHHITQMFQEWLVRHEKSYDRPEELLHRLRIFYENYKFVTERNKKNDGLVLGMTMFADLHTDEFHASSKFTQESEHQNSPKRNEQLTKSSPVNQENQESQENLNQGPVPDSFTWEQTDPSKPLVLPAVGQQDPTCWGANGAWADQYCLTANHYITNKVSTPVLPVSAQWLLDCNPQKWKCGEYLYDNHGLIGENLIMQGEYRGPETGRPGECMTASTSESKSLRHLQQAPANKPLVVDTDGFNNSDPELELLV
jgi:hypothetical protein